MLHPALTSCYLQVEELVDELVDRDVDSTVQDILDNVYMPQKLQDTVNSQREQLDSVRISLHNTLVLT